MVGEISKNKNKVNQTEEGLKLEYLAIRQAMSEQIQKIKLKLDSNRKNKVENRIPEASVQLLEVSLQNLIASREEMGTDYRQAAVGLLQKQADQFVNELQEESMYKSKLKNQVLKVISLTQLPSRVKKKKKILGKILARSKSEPYFSARE
jgi:hypothetical protein